MDANPKTRPWFQLHLSTCVVLMVVAGVLVGLNLRRTKLRYGSMSGGYAFQEMGWPLPCAGKEVSFDSGTKFDAPESRAVDPASDFWKPIWSGIAIDGAVLAFIAVSIAFAVEVILRRRARKRQDPVP